MATSFDVIAACLQCIHAFLIRTSIADPVQKQHGKDIFFKRRQIIGLHQAGKSTWEMSQIMDIGM
jgi:hypothetical protein